MSILSSTDNLNNFSAGGMKQSGKGVSTAHAAPTGLSPFQKHRIPCKTLPVSFEEWSEVQFGVRSPLQFGNGKHHYIAVDNVLALK